MILIGYDLPLMVHSIALVENIYC
ncbi:uncharacterized protein METZ01_LOCUS515382, partial [marine metagenome]